MPRSAMAGWTGARPPVAAPMQQGVEQQRDLTTPPVRWSVAPNADSARLADMRLGSWLETDWSVRRLRGAVGRIGEVLRPDLLVETVGGWVGTPATKVFLSGLNATDSTALVVPTASGAGPRHAALRTASAGSDGIVLRADHALVGKIPALCNGTLARAARSLA